MSLIESALERLKRARSSTAGASSQLVAEKHRASGAVLDLPEERLHFGSKVVWPEARQSLTDVSGVRDKMLGLEVTHDEVRRLDAELRAIRREVMSAIGESTQADGSRLSPVVVITSAVAGDGKSFMAFNLARSMASEGLYEVLLVDGDSVKQTVTKNCDLQGKKGFINFLGDPAQDFMSLCVPTSLDRLHVLPAGVRTDRASDLFSTGRVRAAFERFSHALSGHVVIIDSPPLLLSSESPAMADAAGQVLLIVRAGVTLADAVTESLGKIKENVPVGVVLNAWLPVLSAEKGAYLDYL